MMRRVLAFGNTIDHYLPLQRVIKIPCSAALATLRRDQWRERENHKLFLDSLGKELGVKTLDDWYSVKRERIENREGVQSLLSYYGRSLQKAIAASYPDHPWKTYRFSRVPTDFWKDPNNHRAFVEDLGKSLGFTTFEDWYKVKEEDFLQHHGSGLLRHHGHFSKAVISVFPEHEWNIYNFANTSTFVAFPEYHKGYMQDLARKLGYSSWTDWYRLTRKDLAVHNGLQILAHYQHSISDMVTSIFPSHPWELSQFASLASSQRWSTSNARSFLMKAANINEGASPTAIAASLNEWLRTTTKKDVENMRGGGSLLNAFGSLQSAVRAAFPESDIEQALTHVSKAQSKVFKVLRSIVQDDVQILQNFKHPQLFHEGGQPMELDIWIPQWNLAIEYHGKQHYQSFGDDERFQAQARRDAEKVEACKRAGISLVVIPFWWNGTRSQLVEVISRSSNAPITNNL
eukprot:TRINITY_DN6811_c0_g1_i1.p1 TRINITY_DN6811_c0_g1~~TRINITY_DN6811_c0_g1_i1.p1  ORF type:complete len:459 (+),score=101.36 TRINITY_DN6811_c0_g1_i1:103-1479(+)